MGPKKVIEGVARFMTGLQEMLNGIHQEIRRINTLGSTLTGEGAALSENYYREFHPIRQNLRRTRLGLRSLATETVIMTRKVRIFFNLSERLGNKRALELQMGELEALIDKSIPILQMADREYRASIAKLETLEPMMNTLVAKLNRELVIISNDIASHRAAGTFARVATVATDVLGCSGICYLINNLVPMPTATDLASAMESAVAALDERMDALENLKDMAESILQRTNGLSGNLGGTLNFLEDELGIIQDWRAEVDSVKRDIDTFPLEEIPLVKDIFVIGMDGLQSSAQRFLDQPEDVFTDTAS